jgi:hypothetical protein
MATFRVSVSFGLLAFFALLGVVVLLAIPVACGGQALAPTTADSAPPAALPGRNTLTDGRWEFF